MREETCKAPVLVGLGDARERHGFGRMRGRAYAWEKAFGLKANGREMGLNALLAHQGRLDGFLVDVRKVRRLHLHQALQAQRRFQRAHRRRVEHSLADGSFVGTAKKYT